MLFHTEVVVCPRAAFANDAAFLTLLDGKLTALKPSRFATATGVGADGTAATEPFAPIARDRWSTQAAPGCVQLGYGGANCGGGCCGAPHKRQNSHYALNSRRAVIGNALGDQKEVFLYGASGRGESGAGDHGTSGEDAYRAVCHGQMNAISAPTALPACVSGWAGRDYNPLTNNCNTFTSTILKCVYGLSDAKPRLGVSDLVTVKCPTLTGGKEVEVAQCVVPAGGSQSGAAGSDNEEEEALSSQ